VVVFSFLLLLLLQSPSKQLFFLRGARRTSGVRESRDVEASGCGGVWRARVWCLGGSSGRGGGGGGRGRERELHLMDLSTVPNKLSLEHRA